MKNALERLDWFLELALTSKQFALILLEDEKQKAALIEKLNNITKPLIQTEKLEELKACKTGLVLFTLTYANLKEIMEWLKAVLPTFNQYRVVAGTSDDARIIFILDKALFGKLPEKEQEQILAAFLPIFDFSNG